MGTYIGQSSPFPWYTSLQHSSSSLLSGSTTTKGPYIIGLTGGIASGKSSISKYLESISDGGIVRVDCDQLAHQVYLPETETFKKV